VTRFLDTTYGTTRWTRAALHDWLATMRPPYVIDINRDTQLQESYAGTPHLLILGCARLGGTDYRFRLYAYDGHSYRAIAPERPTRRCRCSSSRWGRRCHSRATLPRTPTMSITSPS
jgi:hypothetical protein